MVTTKNYEILWKQGVAKNCLFILVLLLEDILISWRSNRCIKNRDALPKGRVLSLQIVALSSQRLTLLLHDFDALLQFVVFDFLCIQIATTLLPLGSFIDLGGPWPPRSL